MWIIIAIIITIIVIINKLKSVKNKITLTISHLNSPERQSATVGMDTYFVRATRKAHFRIWVSTHYRNMRINNRK